jgi:hypothetical protein
MPPELLADEPRDIRDEPRDIHDEPPDIRDEPRDIHDQPWDIRDEPRDIHDEPPDIRDEPRGSGMMPASDGTVSPCSRRGEAAFTARACQVRGTCTAGRLASLVAREASPPAVAD